MLQENNFSCANMDSLAWLGLRFWHWFQALTTSSVSLFIWDKHRPFLGSFSPWLTFVYSHNYIFQYRFSERHPGTSRPTGSSTCEMGVWSMGSWPPCASGFSFLQKSFSLCPDFIWIWTSLGYPVLNLFLLQCWKAILRASCHSTLIHLHFAFWSRNLNEIIIIVIIQDDVCCSIWQRYYSKWHLAKFHQTRSSHKTPLWPQGLSMLIIYQSPCY